MNTTTMNTYQDGIGGETLLAGIEFGTSKICVAVAEKQQDGTLRLLGVGEAPSRDRCIRKGTIVDLPMAVESAREALRYAEKKTGVSIRSVRVAYSAAPNLIEQTFACLQSLGLRIAGIVTDPLVSAHGILTTTNTGPSLLIDLGGGTTDYGVLDRFGIRFRGVLHLGGDHITCDLSIGVKIPLAVAETLKIREGSALVGGSNVGKLITLNVGPSSYEIERVTMEAIISLRVREIFEQTRDRIATRQQEEVGHEQAPFSQVLLTGGASRLSGITAVTEEVFGVPVMPAPSVSMTGNPLLLENPAYTAVIGLLHVGLEKTEKKEESEEDLDIPTFLRRGSGNVEIRRAVVQPTS
jgi:cell division ATPase FtsA